MDKVIKEIQSKADACVQVSQDFTRLYYGTFDKRRTQISRLYVDNGVFVWNGNGATTREKIQKYLLELPLSVHTLATLDAQPILDEAIGGQQTVAIQTSGFVKYADSPVLNFYHSVLISAQDGKWRIVNDIYRTLDTFSKKKT